MRTIDADRLLSERMMSTYYHLPNGDTAIPIIDIEHAPTVLAEPERKKGKWIDIKCGSASLWACSKCGEVFPENFHYCPNCGADMREGEDDG